MGSDLVTIARFTNSAEALAAQAALNAAGIDAYADSVELVTMQWDLSNAVGGVKLQVATEDVQAAEALLNRQPTSADGQNFRETRCSDCGLALHADATECPACGWSTDDDEELPYFEEDDGSLDEPEADAWNDREAQTPNSLDGMRKFGRWFLTVSVQSTILVLGIGVCMMIAGILHDLLSDTSKLISSGGYVVLFSAAAITAILGLAKWRHGSAPDATTAPEDDRSF
ncbi:MAG: hypothetical protein KDA75_06600 [Planctomycetaceae bacterium]|nr:hypothetical protein [Planctomycetaceae bacterium]